MQVEAVVVFMEHLNHHQLEVLVVQVLVVRVIMKMMIYTHICTVWSHLDLAAVAGAVVLPGVYLVDMDQVVL